MTQVPAPMIDVLLTDLDGVVRHFDPTVADGLEIEHGLEIGSLRREAFGHPRGHTAITGGLTRHSWTDEVGRAVGSARAAREWLGTRGAADPEMVELIEAVRSTGTIVAVLTNGTDTIHDELETVGLREAFDHVFCSWFIGVAKPDRAIFDHVCGALGVEARRVLFTDDSPPNVAGAAAAGLRGHDFDGVAGLRSRLAAAGVVSG